MEAIELTILMPCLNEAETLAICIAKAKAFLAREAVSGEVLVADNGSSDGSQVIAMQAGATVIHVSQRGYGAALKEGIAAARGRYIIMGDADDSYDFLNLMPFLAKLREGYDVVMGNRFQGGIQRGAMPLLNRYLGNPVLTLIGRVFFSSRIGDFHCGLRGFERNKCLELQLQGDGMEFASEMVVKATLQQLHVTEVPTALYPDGRSRRPHLRPWRDGWRHLRLLLLFSPRWLFFYPGMIAALLGFLLMCLLSGGPLKVGHIIFDIHTMLFGSLLLLVGMQTLCFAVFSEYIAAKHLSRKPPLSLLSWFSLERGLLVSAIFMVSGLLGACDSFWYWLSGSFGPLIPAQMMRVVIPAITSILLGVQLMFASFFMSLLGWYIGTTQSTQ